MNSLFFKIRSEKFISIIVRLFFIVVAVTVFTAYKLSEIQQYKSTNSCEISQSREAMPIGDIAGWHQVFSDNFRGMKLNNSTLVGSIFGTAWRKSQRDGGQHHM